MASKTCCTCVSQATADGNLSLTITFSLGTNLDTGAGARFRTELPSPHETAAGRAADRCYRTQELARHADGDPFSSPDESRDQLYISN